MQKIYLHKINNFFFKKFFQFYFLIGNNSEILYQTQKYILRKKKILARKIIINIKKKKWENFFLLQKEKNIINEKRIFLLYLYEIKEIIKITTYIKKKKIKFHKNNIFFIFLCFPKCMNYIQIKTFLFFKKKIFIDCVTFKKKNILFLFKKIIKKKKIKIKKKAINYLFKKYEGNQTAILQFPTFLFLNFNKKKIKEKNIKKIIIKQPIYYPIQWRNAIFLNDFTRSVKIIKYLYKNKYNPFFLAQLIKKDILKMIQIKKNEIKTFEIKKKNKKMISIIKKTSLKCFHLLIKIILKIEIKKTQNNQKYIWKQIYLLTHILCN